MLRDMGEGNSVVMVGVLVRISGRFMLRETRGEICTVVGNMKEVPARGVGELVGVPRELPQEGGLGLDPHSGSYRL